MDVDENEAEQGSSTMEPGTSEQTQEHTEGIL